MNGTTTMQRHMRRAKLEELRAALSESDIYSCRVQLRSSSSSSLIGSRTGRPEARAASRKRCRSSCRRSDTGGSHARSDRRCTHDSWRDPNSAIRACRAVRMRVAMLCDPGGSPGQLHGPSSAQEHGRKRAASSHQRTSVTQHEQAERRNTEQDAAPCCSCVCVRPDRGLSRPRVCCPSCVRL